MRRKYVDALESKVEILPTEQQKVLMIRFRNNEEIMTLHNLSAGQKKLSLPKEYKGKKMKMIFSPEGESRKKLSADEVMTLDSFAYLWLEAEN